MNKFLEMFALEKSFPKAGGSVRIVRDFSLSLREGEFVSLIGHSGCGKSTVLSMVAGLTAIDLGGVVLAGKEIHGPGPDRGMVFQSPCLLPWLSVVGNVSIAVACVKPRASKKEQRAIATHYLELVGLGDALDQRVTELSQGMQQRVGIARAFALEPKMLLLDEPFGMLDSITRAELQEVLSKLCADTKKTTLMVTHDVDESLFLSDRVAMMTSGPDATLGGILDVPFARPRDRRQVFEDETFERLREELLGFLEDQAHAPVAPAKQASASMSRFLSSAEQAAS
ncbi:MAG: nitrate transporter ATP-binding protein [Myxococcaceae bacterium]|nr:nitrate transporter ATP-binding protein [Myxococcaceae bacterium]